MFRGCFLDLSQDKSEKRVLIFYYSSHFFIPIIPIPLFPSHYSSQFFIIHHSLQGEGVTSQKNGTPYSAGKNLGDPITREKTQLPGEKVGGSPIYGQKMAVEPNFWAKISVKPNLRANILAKPIYRTKILRIPDLYSRPEHGGPNVNGELTALVPTPTLSSPPVLSQHISILL